VAGVVTGLAWTPTGGDILFIETSLTKGKGKLTLTGNLGDVMKESAMIALEYLKGHNDRLNLDQETFDKWNVHIHVPQGAVPKDGPSAGISLLSAVASIFTQRKVKGTLAMTGEITLRGLVLPVGGIKEKVLAAKRAGIEKVILPKKNEKDVDEIEDDIMGNLEIQYLERMDSLLDIVLEDKPEKDPTDFFHVPDSQKKNSDGNASNDDARKEIAVMD
jgi:ATP-dependent Lon protease